jgi:hypothetical protein
MTVTCDLPGVRFYMNPMEVVIVTFFPDGMPNQMERVGIERFISECKRIREAMP